MEMETATISPLERAARALCKAQSGTDCYDAMGDDYPLNMAWPTHWMPLPAPPEDAE